LTALQSPELAKELIRQGIDYFEGKPAKMDLLAAKVRALVEKRTKRKYAASDDCLRSDLACVTTNE
jgi:DNA-binding response OmpR family regulator